MALRVVGLRQRAKGGAFSRPALALACYRKWPSDRNMALARPGNIPLDSGNSKRAMAIRLDSFRSRAEGGAFPRAAPALTCYRKIEIG